MAEELCMCFKCNPYYIFKSEECMFCHGKLEGEGTLRSVHGARVCTKCMTEAMRLLVTGVYH